MVTPISTTVALSVIHGGPALSAFLIFHSSECCVLVNVPGGSGSVAVDYGQRGRGNEQRANEGQLRLFRHRVSLFVFKTSVTTSPRRRMIRLVGL